MVLRVYHVEDKSELDLGRSVLSVPPDARSYPVWSAVRDGDALIVLSTVGGITIWKALVVARNILDASESSLRSQQRLLFYLGGIEIAKVNRLDLRTLSELQHGKEFSESASQRFLGDLTFEPVPSCSTPALQVVFPYSIDDVRSINLVVSSSEDAVLHRLSLDHPFGDAKGSIRLVLKERDKVVAGAALRLSYDWLPPHNAESALFGRNAHVLKSRSLSIARLFSVQTGHRKQSHFVWLLKAISYLAPSVYSEPTSFIAGVSYDLIPAALKAGFSAHIPSHRFGSIYYWKCVFAQSAVATTSAKAIRVRFRQFARSRQSKAWAVNGNGTALSAAQHLSRWGVADSRSNRGAWRSVKAGDILYVCVNGRFIVGHATVIGTDRQSIRGFERFPLGFALDEVTQLRAPIDLWQVAAREWVEAQGRSGIVGVPPELHFAIMNVIDDQAGALRMWVNPNPFLLHHTRFTAISKNVFVVQSWELKETILPIIERVCHDADWTISHASDREGQVVFDDIWLMLNQCEAVLVDFTGRRPNVYLEFGMALVLGKPIVAITQDQADLPSDTPNLKYRTYRSDANAFFDLAAKLPTALHDTVEDMRIIQEARGAQ